MEKLNLQTEIGEGKDIESSLLFNGARRKIMQITLRRNAVLKAHQAAEPSTIQCVAGAGVAVEHIIGLKKNEFHPFTSAARLEDGTLFYGSAERKTAEDGR